MTSSIKFTTKNTAGKPSGSPAQLQDELPPELYLYREHTIGLLRRYFRLSVELGRLPSLLGREFFRARVSSYRLSTFEDAVIIVHDIDRCLEKLEPMGRQMIARMVFQEYTAEETANLLHCARRTVIRRYMEALDRLSEVFLETGLLRRFPSVAQRPSTEKKQTHAAGPDITACAEDIFPELPAAALTPRKRVNPLNKKICAQATLAKANIVFAGVSHLPSAV